MPWPDSAMYLSEYEVCTSRMKHIPSKEIILRQLDTTRSIVHSSGVYGRRQGRVDRKHDPSKKSILDTFAQLDIVEKGIAGAIHRRLSDNDLVISIFSHRIGIGIVRRQQLHSVTDRLVPERLADVRGSQVVDGAVLTGRSVPVQNGMDVSGTSSTARKDFVSGNRSQYLNANRSVRGTY